MFRAFEELNTINESTEFLAENNRQIIIDNIKKLGKNYNFRKYTDGQLYAILNRLQNDSKKASLPSISTDTEIIDDADYRNLDRCDYCNTVLNPLAQCPVCDLGEEDFNESFFDINLPKSNWVSINNPNIQNKPISKNASSSGKDKFIVTIFYDNKNHKLRAKADDGIHGEANVAFPNNLRNHEGQQYEVDNLIWNGKNYRASGNIKPIGVVNTQNINENFNKENPKMNFNNLFEELSRLYEEDELVAEETVDEAPIEEPAADEPKQLVLECSKCGALVIKAEDDVEVDDETDLADIEDACAFCEEAEGYKIIGTFIPSENNSTEVAESLYEGKQTVKKIFAKDLKKGDLLVKNGKPSKVREVQVSPSGGVVIKHKYGTVSTDDEAEVEIYTNEALTELFDGKKKIDANTKTKEISATQVKKGDYVVTQHGFASKVIGIKTTPGGSIHISLKHGGISTSDEGTVTVLDEALTELFGKKKVYPHEISKKARWITGNQLEKGDLVVGEAGDIFSDELDFSLVTKVGCKGKGGLFARATQNHANGAETILNYNYADGKPCKYGVVKKADLSESTENFEDSENLQELFGFGKKKNTKGSGGSSTAAKESQVTIEVYDENGTKQFGRTFTEISGKMSAEDQFNEVIKSNGLLSRYKSSSKKSDWSYVRKSNPPSPKDTDKYINPASRLIKEY